MIKYERFVTYFTRVYWILVLLYLLHMYAEFVEFVSNSTNFMNKKKSEVLSSLLYALIRNSYFCLGFLLAFCCINLAESNSLLSKSSTFITAKR